MSKINKIKVDDSKILIAIQSGLPLTITTYTLPHEMEDYIANVLRSFLTLLGQTQMIECLCYCVKELVNNAKKANTKRVYFKEKKLDINNIEEYNRGMVNFKQDTITDIKYYLELQRKQGYYIKTIFQSRNNKIKVEIRNKAELTVFEYKRIHDKITRAQQYDSIEEGLNQVLDNSEGAGLGLVMMMLILRRIGLTEENYQVLSENGETITRLILPFSKEVIQNINNLSKEFVDLIYGLPEFPENISQINRLISDPNSKMSDIAMRISSDVSLTGELLKLVNSAAYMRSQKCNSISTALKIVGLRGIRNLLFSIGSMENLMISSNSDNKKLWNHSYKVAFFAYNLARNFCTAPSDRNCIEDSYVCGLLHDMGKIIFANAHTDIKEKIKNLCLEKGISTSLFETLVAGVNHGEVGAKIAEKWNFPESISEVLRYHHEPSKAPDAMKKLTSLVNLADSMDHYIEGDINYEQIDQFVLKLFNITSEEQLQGITERLKKSFNNES